MAGHWTWDSSGKVTIGLAMHWPCIADLGPRHTTCQCRLWQCRADNVGRLWRPTMSADNVGTLTHGPTLSADKTMSKWCPTLSADNVEPCVRSADNDGSCVAGISNTTTYGLEDNKMEKSIQPTLSQGSTVLFTFTFISHHTPETAFFVKVSKDK